MLIKRRIQKKLQSTLSEMAVEGHLKVKVTPTEQRFGDYTTNMALELSQVLKKPPRVIAENIRDKIHESGSSEFDRVEVATPGFVNLTLSVDFRSQSLKEILARREYPEVRFPDLEKTYTSKKILLEYVSANPTGPLHVGHGRWAVIGSILARILSIAGAEVYQEFYVNDAGQQIQKLRESINAVREKRPIPEDGYHGDYVHNLAQSNRDPIVEILEGQKQVLEFIGVKMDGFYSEKSLYDDHLVEEVLAELKNQNLAYKKEGAWWFPSTQEGDDKDRVLVRSTGEATYFGVDIAYHYTKFTRGYPHLINVLGADHHGYVKRIASAVKMISRGEANLEAVLGQLVSVLRGGKPVRMSKRSGDFVLLKEVVEEIGVDALRYFFSMRSPNMPLEFDLELAKEKTLNNPVFYIQYSHARIASVRKKAFSLDISPIEVEDFDFSFIANPTTVEIANKLLEWEEEILLVSQTYELQHINNYLYGLSTLFHRYYNQEIFISTSSPESRQLSRYRLLFLEAIDRVLLEGLFILGISAPDTM